MTETLIAEPPVPANPPTGQFEPDPAIMEGGREVIGGVTYYRGPKGELMPAQIVKAADLLVDETVRRMIGFAVPLNRQIARFKAHSLDDVASVQALLAQEYGAKVGGAKGNLTLTSLDGCLKVQVQIQDRLTFGPELHAAKALVDAFIEDKAEGADPVLKALVMAAFRADQSGQLNRAELFRLLRHDIDDDRWKAAMRALKDSIRVDGSKEHIRFFRRADPSQRWEPITIDVADA